MIRTHKYADGGKVIAKPTSNKPRPPPPKPTQPPERRRSTVDIMRGKTRRENEQALGLKDGGPVRRFPPSAPMPPPERGPKPKKIVGKPKR